MDDKGQYQPNGTLAPRLVDAATGPWSAADDLLTTVDAYGRFLTGVIRSDWLTPDQTGQRSHILISLVGDPIWNCQAAPQVRCADAYGHGIGWMVYRYGDKTVLIHGGNDAGENALVYYSPQTRNGAIIFVNGAEWDFRHRPGARIDRRPARYRRLLPATGR